MAIELKIKSKHLSEEARIIRREENKLHRQCKWLRERQKDDTVEHRSMMNLKGHRKWNVRNENRATFLARAFIAGKAYKEVEQKCHNIGVLDYVIAPRILTMVNKYHDKKVTISDIRDWYRS